MATIPAQKGIGFRLKCGDRLVVVDPQGGQVSDLFCFRAEDPGEYLSSGRSIDYADTIFLSRGHTLYSNRSEAMLEILEDSCGRHDFLLTPCSLKMFQIVGKNEDWHPSCHENLAVALESFGISPDQIGTTFNIFMHVTVANDGRLAIRPPLSRPGSRILFEAKMDLWVGLTACSHEETNGGQCKPVEYELFPVGEAIPPLL